MSWIRVLISRCTALMGQREPETDLDEELRSHLEMAAEENENSGMSPEEARREALRSFGGVTQVRESFRGSEGIPSIENLLRDFGYAFRQMKRSPGFAVTVIGTLALGIGAATAMFTVVDHMLLRALPYRDAARLVELNEGGTKSQEYPMSESWPDIREWQTRSHAFEAMSFWGYMNGRNYLENQASAIEVNGTEVSAGLFPLLGVKPILGRGFDAISTGDSSGKNSSNIILSYSLWQGAFGRDKAILGRVVHINQDAYTVIGVMPRGFTFPVGNGPAIDQVWTAVRLKPADKIRSTSSDSFTAIGLLKPGVTFEVAQSEMKAIQKSVAPEYPDPEVRDERSSVLLQRVRDTFVDADTKKALLALLAASGVLWLIASLNVTNLLLARSTARQREMAVRGALGASRRRVVQQMMIEGLVLSSASAALGIGLAVAGIKLAQSVKPMHLDLNLSTQLNFTILAVLCGLTVTTAVVSSAWPALIAARAPLDPALKQGSMQSGTGRRHHRMRGALVAAEVAMSLALLVVCGLLLRTIYTLRQVPLGYRTDHIIVANLNVPSFRYTNKNVWQVLYSPLLERVQHLHGVQAAGLMSEVPLGQTFNMAFSVYMKGGKPATGMLKYVTPDIQRVFGFKMLAGRFYESTDTLTSEPVVLVNPAFARLYAPDKHDPASIVGMQAWNLRKNAPPMHFIGILDNTRQSSIQEPPQPEVEVCLCQLTPDAGVYQPSTIAMDLAIRTDRSTREMIPELRDILRHASPELANATVTTMDQIVEDSYGSQRLAAHLLEIFGGIALLLCIAGLYGLLAYVVTQRTRELGLRIALGAQRGNLVRMVMRQAGGMLVLGVIAGTGLALASGRLVRGFLYGVTAHDGWTLAGAAVLLLASGLAAAYIPARRAAGVDPMQALRTE